MAEKGFGVKDINLIGPSGTPTITSPNNLNLNAVNVAISTNVSIGGTLTVTGNVSIGGTLTYEDVTNIDSVGIVTARSGINLTGGNITLGDSGSTSDDRIVLGADSDLMIYHNGSDSVIREQGTGNLDIQTTGGNVDILVNTTEHAAKFISNGAVELYHDGSLKLSTGNNGINVSGSISLTDMVDYILEVQTTLIFFMTVAILIFIIRQVIFR